MSIKNKIKRQKAEHQAQIKRKGILALAKWNKEYFENQSEYPTSVKGEKKKKLNSIKEFRKLLKKPKSN